MLNEVSNRIKQIISASLCARTTLKKLKERKMALILHEKLTRLPYNSCWSQYIYPDRNLETQKSLKKTVRLLQKYIPQVEPDKVLLSQCPVDYIGVDYKTDLLEE
jgi:hypothetical protein